MLVFPTTAATRHRRLESGSTTTTSTTPAAPTTPTYYQVSLDASQASLTGKMGIGTDATAGSYFGVPRVMHQWYIPAPAAAKLLFHRSHGRTYNLWSSKSVNDGGSLFMMVKVITPHGHRAASHVDLV